MICFSTASKHDKHKLLFAFSIFIFSIVIISPVYGDSTLTLNDAINMGLDHSFGLKSSRSSLNAAEYDYTLSKAVRYPTISLNVSGFYINRLVKVDALPGGIELGSHENYLADFKFSIPLYTGGRSSGLIGAKKAIYNAAISELESAHLKVAYQCRLAWLNLSLTDKLVKSAETSLNRIDIIKEDVINLHLSGLADSVDIFDAELALEYGWEQLLKAKNGNRKALIKLASLIGIQKRDNTTPAELIIDPQSRYSEYDLTKFKLDILSRPELTALKNKIDASIYKINLNKAAYLPSISGFAGYSSGKPNRDMFGGDWDDYFSTGIMLNWDFNLGGQTGKLINLAREQSRSAEIIYWETFENMIEVAESALENLMLANDIYLSSKKKYDIAKNKFRLAKEKREAGSLSSNRLLEIEAELSAAEQRYYASQLEFYIYESHFLYAIGSDKIYGGF